MPRDDKKVPWFLTPAAIAMAVLLAGPLAIPLVWMSGALRRWQKIAVTSLLVALTAWLLKSSADLYSILLEEMRELRDVLH